MVQQHLLTAGCLQRPSSSVPLMYCCCVRAPCLVGAASTAAAVTGGAAVGVGPGTARQAGDDDSALLLRLFVQVAAGMQAP